MSSMFDDSDVDNPPVYKKGDIVWVKLSSYWWPGEVKNEEDLPSDLLTDFKKPPLVIVKFFEEDSYEYIKHWSHIYPYDCDRKNDFIKKGMGGFRAKLSHMSTFPRDVTTAEEKTNGDPNILSQPEFLPNKKINYDEIFGTPTPKKSLKSKSLSAKKSVTKDPKAPLVTHRRFIGNDDYKSFILIQEPCKDRQPDSEDEEIKKLNQEPEEIIKCTACNFSTARLGVLLIHNKLHLEGNASVSVKRKFKKSKEDSTTESNVTERKPAKPKPIKPKIINSEPKPATASFANLLDEWNDSDEEMETPVKQKKSNHSKIADVSSEEQFDLFNSSQEEQTNTTVETEDGNKSKSTDPNKNNTQDDIKNCFDFDEEEEEDDSFLYPASTGRKIPRVIPEKPRASISELLELSDKEDEPSESKSDKQEAESNTIPDEDDNRKKEILRVSQSFNRAPVVDESLETTFKDLMEETEVPVLDEVTHTLKSEQNFHDVRTIKFPDKGGTTVKTPAKSGTSKKRFITSFEDFEAGFRKVDATSTKEKQEKDVNSNSDQKECSKDNATENISIEHRDSSTDLSSPATPEKSVTLVKKRRKFKQLIIEEDSEKIVEYIREDYDSLLNQSTQESPIDSELAGIKHDLESPNTSSERLKESQANTELSLEELTRDLESSNTSLDILSKDSVTEDSTTVKNNTTIAPAKEDQNLSRRSSRLRGVHASESPELTQTKKIKRKGLEAKSSHSDVESITKENADIKKGKSRSRKDSEKDQVKQEVVVEKPLSDDVEKQTLRRGRSRKSEHETSDVPLLKEDAAKIENVEDKTVTESHVLTTEPVESTESVSPKSRKRGRRKISSSSPSGNFKEVEHEDGLRTRSQKHRKIDDSHQNTSVDDPSKNIKVETFSQATEKETSSDSQIADTDKVTENAEVLNHENSLNTEKLSEETLNADEFNSSEGKVGEENTENQNIKDLTFSEALNVPSAENKKLDISEKDITPARKGRSTRSSAMHKPSSQNTDVKIPEEITKVQLEEVTTPRRRRGRSQLKETLPTKTPDAITSETTSIETTESRSTKSKKRLGTDHVCADNETDSKYKIAATTTEENVSDDIKSKSKHKASSNTNILSAEESTNLQIEDTTTPKKRGRSRRSESAKDTTIAPDTSSENLISTEKVEKPSRTLRSDASKADVNIDKTNQKNELIEESESSVPQVVEGKTIKRRRGRSQRFSKTDADNSNANQDISSAEKIVSPENTESLKPDNETEIIDATAVTPDNKVDVRVGDISLPATCAQQGVELNQSAAEPEVPVKGENELISTETEAVIPVDTTASVAHLETLDDTKTTSLSTEEIAVTLEEIPLPEPPVAMLDIPVEDIPLPPSPPPEVQAVTNEIQKVVNPEELQDSNNSVQIQDGTAEPTNTTVSTDTSNILLESIPIPDLKTDDKERYQEQKDKVENLTFSLEDIPIPETLENNSSCATNASNKSIQSSDLPKSFEQSELDMTHSQQSEKDNEIESSFNLEDIPIPTTTPEKDAEATSLNSDVSCQKSESQEKLESPEKSLVTDLPVTSAESFEDFMQQNTEQNLEKPPKNEGVVCETKYEQKPETSQSGRRRRAKRWDVPEAREPNVVESDLQPEGVPSLHKTSELQNVSHSKVEIEAQSKQFGQLDNSEASLSEATFSTGLENLSNSTFEEFTVDATTKLDQESNKTVTEENKINDDNFDQSSAVEKDPVTEHTVDDPTNFTQTPEVTAESKETCNSAKGKNRGRRKQILSSESEPIVEFTSNDSNLVEKSDKNQGITTDTSLSAENTIQEILEGEKNECLEKDESFSFRKEQLNKQTEALDNFKTLFDDEEVISPQSELKPSTKDHEQVVDSSETAVSKTIPSTEGEIILPLKKSKRVNEISSLISSDSFTRTSDSEFSFRSACDDSFMSTSMRNNIDRLINEIDSVDTSGVETLSSSSLECPMFSQIGDTEKSHVLEPLGTEWKSVPPKKKKVDLNEPQSDDKPEESVPQPPKKKMQKLFESSQPPKSVDVPLMSPLAKKKSFYFHDFEKFEQSLLTRDSSLSSNEDSSADEAVDQSVELDQPSKNEQKDNQELPEPHCDTSNSSESNLESSISITETEIQPPTDKDEKSNVVELATEQVTQLEKETEKSNTTEPLEANSGSNQETVELKKDEPEVKIPTSGEPELIPITVAPTVMSEKDLDDAQVEITSDVVISEKKPSSSFSVNFDTAIGTKTDNLSDTIGTEFTSKAMIKEFDNKSLTSQPNTYVLKSELLDILEGNSNSSTNSSGSEQKFKTSFDNYDKKNTVQGIIDFEDAIPPQIVITNKINTESVLLDSPKLLERLSMSTDIGTKCKPKTITEIKSLETLPKTTPSKIAKPTGLPKPGQKILIRTSKSMVAASPKTTGSKPIILSEQIIRRAGTASSIPKIATQGVKREYEDIEDVEAAFIIPKIAKKSVEDESVSTALVEKPTKAKGKAGKPKILQQTIISPKGDVVPQRAAATNKHNLQLQTVQGQFTRDDAVFDINSMPIVLSDDLLTPESIQNMPVVLSDEIQTASTAKPQDKPASAIPKKTIVSTIGAKQIIFKTTQSSSIPLSTVKQPTKLKNVPPSIASTIQTKLAQGGTTAFIATGTTPDGKTAKYVLVPPSVTPANTQVKAIKQNIIKKQPVAQSKASAVGVAAPTNAAQVVGNKIMIVTNAQGQQTRVVLTPQQQKVLMPAVGKTKTVIKGAIPKALLENATGVTIAGPSGVTAKATPILSQGVTSTQPKTITPSSQTAVTSAMGLLMPVVKNVKSSIPMKKVVQKSSKPQKTILIKNQLGQTVRKIQGTDDADLDRQVAEQLEAIKASARLQQANKTPEIINFTNRSIPNSTSPANRAGAIKKSYIKKVEAVKTKVPAQVSDEGEKKQDTAVPALSPLSPQSRIPQVSSQSTVSKVSTAKQSRIPTSKTTDVQTASPQKSISKSTTTLTTKTDKPTETKRSESPVRQVVIQDGLGNLTTVTVGQILAIPSETVDGQPQSYMLVTVDESGNLTPLNNDALMSLDPSLGLGGDINNVVLQVDQGQGTVAAAVKPTVETKPSIPVSQKNKVEERLKPEKPKAIPQPSSQLKPVLGVPNQPEVPMAVEQPIVAGEGVVPADAGGQQLIVTGDPVATQKFLESLSDGSTDLAGILAKAEGGSVLIQTDGQQILIRTNADAQSDLGLTDSELLTSHKPNQDILAAALANTDVFQSAEHSVINQSIVKGVSSAQLSPGTGAGLFPMQVGNVLETSLTLSSPIMTPLELPSTNSKKIDDEADVLGQVPKNVDLPITITDPNISQTVAHQPTLMELSLPIPDNSSSQDINSPSFPYALTTIEESVGLSQKSFNGSMPLLTEDVIEHRNVASPSSDKVLLDKDSSSNFSANFDSLPLLDTIDASKEDNKTSAFGNLESLPMLSEDVVEDSGSSMGSSKLPRSSPKSLQRDIVDEGLSTLGGEMCSSLSEPPPDMFDLSSLAHKEEEISSDLSSIPEPETLSINSENSNEIPLQPPIVASLSDLKRHSDEDSEGSDEKRPRFDD